VNDQFLENLADHEEEKVQKEQDTRQKILMYAGARLNWIGDYVGNPNIKWEEKELELDQIEFTGNDKFLIEGCDRSPKKFQELVLNDQKLKEKYTEIVSTGSETILGRISDRPNKFKILDGIHRLMGAALEGKKTIKVMVPLNETEVLPICEAHTVYDLIRGFQRHRRTEAGETELFYGLKLLLHTYENTRELLEKRFNQDYVNDDKVQAVIKKVLNDRE